MTAQSYLVLPAMGIDFDKDSSLLFDSIISLTSEQENALGSNHRGTKSGFLDAKWLFGDVCRQGNIAACIEHVLRDSGLFSW